MGRPALKPEDVRTQESYRMPRWMQEWLRKDGESQTPPKTKAKHIEDILTRYVTRKIAKQNRAAK